jgi:hypothetical protein
MGQMKNEREEVSHAAGPTQTTLQKLTDWTKEPAVLDLKGDLEAARPSHDAMVRRVRKWNNLRDATGEYRPKKIKGRSSVQPKLIRRQAEWRYSALSEPFLSTDRLFNIMPTTFEDEFGAKQNDLVLNWQFRTKLNKVSFIDQYVRTGVDEGTVIVRLGWHRETVMVEKEVPIVQYLEIQSEEEMVALQEAVAMKQQNPRSYFEMPEEMKAAIDYLEETGRPTVATITGMQMVEEEEIVENKPTAEIMDPENVWLDPSCQGDITKSKFLIVSFETTKAELLKDKRYKNLGAVNWSGNRVLSQPDHVTETPQDFQLKDDLRTPIVAYEYWGYWDIDGNETLVPIVATWIGDTLVRMEKNPFPDNQPPFVVVPYLPVKRQVTGEPDAEILEDNQAILGALMRGMIDLMGRSANAQQGMAKGFLDVTNRRRFEAGQDYEYNPGGDPRMSVYQHTYPEIPASAMNMVTLQNQEAEALTGVKAFAGGLSGQAYGDVAAGIKGMLDASAKREMNILRRMAKGMQDIGRKIMAMNAVFLSEEEVVRVTNREFVKVRREDLKGNFDLIVDINTAEVDEAKAQDLGFMLQTMGPNMDPMMVNKILAQIADLKRMPALAEEIRNYKPQPDPIAEEMRKLELRKMQAEVEKLESEVRLKAAQTDKTQSEADLLNLEYVEEETGTKHARDLEKQSAQARANQDLEVTKSFLNTRKPDETRPDVEAAVGFNALTEAQGMPRTGY